ncbi:MAG: EAL and GGDEF domain-containing protein [Calditerrivibrio sp.]|nr:EAL and GGDEF domain-containing protein [Calditerrivibrio sp.]MCA1980192.1 EAL and GGDEF domain-containing protein [Calditerrivibrio sp.]
MTQYFQEKWTERLEYIDYALQPIVSTISGKLHGVELLIRGVEKLGFNSIDDFFNAAYKDMVMVPLEKALREKAISKVSKINNYKNIVVFYNYDHRIMEMPDYHFGFTEDILSKYGINYANWCLELTEKLNYNFTSVYNKVLIRAKKSGFKFAIDDFGAGYSNFELLYHSEPDYVKLDKFLIRDINKDVKKSSLNSAMIRMAKSLGITVIAEGVETEEEYYYLKALDVDMIQGYFVQKPTVNVEEIQEKYEVIESLYIGDKRNKPKPNGYLKDEIDFIKPIEHDKTLMDVLDYFKNSSYDFIPIVDNNYKPVGIIVEKDLREYIYSPFGRELLTSKLHKKKMTEFIRKNPSIDIRSNIEDALNLVVNYSSLGIFITDDSKYLGFISNIAMLKILNDIRIKQAFETNPLTGLPGNTLITESINGAMKDENNFYYAVYFDFDNFKPFNDKFGFRIGDRAIKAFSDILRRHSNNNIFAGHIGGDDFFMMIKSSESNCEFIMKFLSRIRREFLDFTSSFYSLEDIANQSYTSVDRYGNIREFKLLDVSSSIIEIPNRKCNLQESYFSKIIAELKKVAKANEDKVVISTLIC